MRQFNIAGVKNEEKNEEEKIQLLKDFLIGVTFPVIYLERLKY